MNQCDGCASGRLLDDHGNHHMGHRGPCEPEAYCDLMGCQAWRYAENATVAHQDDPGATLRARAMSILTSILCGASIAFYFAMAAYHTVAHALGLPCW